MKRVLTSSAALLLAITSTAWAGVEPYPTAMMDEQTSTTTRAQVLAELHEGQRLGLVSVGEAGFSNIGSVDTSGSAAGVTGNALAVRARIHAETGGANRLGLLSTGEGNAPVATAEQEAMIAAAGQRAVEAIDGRQPIARVVGK